MQVGHGQAASTGVAAGQDRGGGAPVRLDESRAALLLAAQRDVLQGIVGGAPLSEVLASLLGIVEAISPDGVIGSVLLLDADGVHLRHGAAPSLAPAYVAAIDGIAIGPGVGSCGTAAYRREQVIVEDIAVDPLWDDFREAALAADLRACWSTPIMAGGDRVLGTFAMYYPAPRRPSPSDLALIDVLVRTVAVAIERRRGDEERDEALAAERAARAEAERTREELRFVLDVTTRIAAGSDYETTLQQLAELAVPALGDLCMIDVLDGGTLRRAATAHHLPSHARTAASLTRYAAVLPAAHPTSTALAAGAAQCVPVVTEQRLRAFAVDDEHLRLLTSLGIESTIAVPLIARGDVFGALTLHSAGSGRRFGERDVALAQDLARRAALAITNVRLYQAARDAEQRLSVSARAAAALTSSLDVEEIVERLGPILVPEVASVCEIHVVRDDRRLARRTFGADGGSTAAVVANDAVPPLVRRAIADGVALPIGDPAGRARRDVFAAAPAATGPVRAGLVAPLAAGGERLGAIAVELWSDRDAAADRELLQVLAGRTALAVYNGRLFDQQRRTADVLQRSLLPPFEVTIPGVDFATSYHPALDGLVVGGDFYDVVPLGGGAWGMLVGDVSGKGAEAAAVTGKVRYAARAAAAETASPAAVLKRVNAVVSRDETRPADARFATVCFARLEPGERSLDVVVALAGHPQPLLLRRDGSMQAVGRTGTLLGIFDEIDVTDTALRLGPGDAFIALTDGVLEARDAGGRHLADDLPRRLPEHAGAPAATLASVIEQAALTWSVGGPRDDIAVVVAAVPS